MQKPTAAKEKHSQFNWHSIKVRLIGVFILFTLVTVFVIGTTVNLRVSKQTEEDYTSRISQQLELVEANLNQYIGTIKNNTEMLSSLPLVQAIDENIKVYKDEDKNIKKIPMKPLETNAFEAEVYKSFEAFVKANPSVKNIYIGVAETGGFLQYPASDRENGYDARERSWYKKALENPEKVSFSDVYVTSSGELVIYAVVPVKDNTNKLKGVIGIDIDLTDLTQLVDSIQIGKKGYMMITDGKGNIMADPKHPDLIGKEIGALGIENLKALGTENVAPFLKDYEDGSQHWIKVEKSDNVDFPMNYIIFVDSDEFHESAKTIMGQIILICLLILVVAVFTAYWLSSKIANPIQFIAKYMKNLGEGDFREVMPHSYLQKQDELGVLATAADQMKENLMALIQQMSGTTTVLFESATELKRITDSAAYSSEETAHTIEEIAKGATEQAVDTETSAFHVDTLSKLLENDAKHMTALNISATEIEKAKEDGVARMQGLIEVTQTSFSATQAVSEIIHTNNASADKIEQASSMIQSIADQTNLLALNAAIEAARAGEAGRGFSVVADEIRKLAEQSTRFTEEIKSVIDELKRQSSVAVYQVGELMDASHRQKESVEETEVQFKNIAYSIETIKSIIELLNQSGTDMAKNKDQLVGLMQNLSAIAEENAAGTEEASAAIEEQSESIVKIAKSTEDFAALARELELAINQFKL